MSLVKNTTFGGLRIGERDVADAAVEIAPTGPLATWRISLTRPGGGNLTEDPVTTVPEVQDLMLVLGYEWQ